MIQRFGEAVTWLALRTLVSRASIFLNYLRSQLSSHFVNLQLLGFCPENLRNEPGFMPKVSGMCRLRTPQVSPKLHLRQQARRLIFYAWLSVYLAKQKPPVTQAPIAICLLRLGA